MKFHIFVLVLLYQLSAIYCDCTVQFDYFDSPEIWKSFGSNKIKYTGTSIKFTDGFPLTLKCVNGFTRPNGYETIKEVNLECRGDTTYITSNFTNDLATSDRPKCNEHAFKMYEATESFVWCHQDYMSYIITEDILSGNNSYLAGVCYDFANMKIISLYHSLSAGDNDMYPKALENYQLGREAVSVSEVFDYKMYDKNDYGITDSIALSQMLDFYKDVIMLNEYFDNDIRTNFQRILHTVWWTKMLHGNWKRYEARMRQQNEKEPFNILAGVSEELVKVPVQDDYDNTQMFELKTKTGDVPLYIWNYLQSTVNPDNKFVVIAVNTPFYKLYNTEDLIFCEDICSQVEWLNDISKSFSTSTQGRIFCCYIDVVAKSKRLKGFPANINQIKN